MLHLCTFNFVLLSLVIVTLLTSYFFRMHKQRIIDIWKGLKEGVIMAKNVQQPKEKVDKYRYGDRTTQVELRPCIL